MTTVLVDRTRLLKSEVPASDGAVERFNREGPEYRKRTLERFYKYVDFTETCWLWTGSRYSDSTGITYGQFSFRGVRLGAHRASYLLHVGPIPAGLDILHSCDVKACVRPQHLRPGTHQENIREAFAKFPPGKFAGENAGRARLTWPQVHAIRAAAGSGTTQAALAAQYRVTPVAISLIVRGLRWREAVA